MPGRQYVFATWNLWGGNAPGVYTCERGISRGALLGSRASLESDSERTWQRRVQLLAAELARIAPDVVAFQESTQLRHGATCAADLAERLGMHLVEDGHPRGLALLSRWPVRAARGLQLSAETFGYPAPLLVEVDVSRGPLTCIVLHLPLARSGDRAPLVRELAASLDSLRVPLVVFGDLNAPPGDPVIDGLLATGLRDVSALAGPTVPNPGPVVRLDYVLLRADAIVRSAATLGHCADEPGYLPSDHLGVVVELEL